MKKLVKKILLSESCMCFLLPHLMLLYAIMPQRIEKFFNSILAEEIDHFEKISEDIMEST